MKLSGSIEREDILFFFDLMRWVFLGALHMMLFCIVLYCLHLDFMRMICELEDFFSFANFNLILG